MKNRYSIAKTTISVTLLCLVTVSTMAAGRGVAGSDTRAFYCATKFSTCLSNARRDCPVVYTPVDKCYNSEGLACKNMYGSTSDCKTRLRETTASKKPTLSPNPQAKQVPKTTPSIRNNIIRKHIKPKSSTTRK